MGDNDDVGLVARDVLSLTSLGFLAIVMILLPHINPPESAQDRSADPPGSVVVEMRWPDESQSDIDLWVQAPGDVPVGFSNKGGKIFDLLRDDLGHRVDISAVNYEISFSRGIAAGEYTVNVHFYRSTMEPGDVPVTVEVSVRVVRGGPLVSLVRTEVVLRRAGEEITALRFRLTADGSLVPGSIHNIPKALYAYYPR